jgi:paraquat-inducible protein B
MSTDTETVPPDRPLDLAEPVLSRRHPLRLSLVWIVPIVSLLIGIGVLVRTLLLSGPLITIEFRSAEGLEAGRTEIRFKEVVIGRVTRVSLGPHRQTVRVTARLDKSVDALAVSDSRFWVVRPRIGGSGVTGLSTLVSGAYIGVDAGESNEQASEFVGLDTPPLLLRGEPGRSFVLLADDLGSLDVGSPVYYRHVRAGRVVGYALDPVARSVSVQVFIEAPHDQLVTRRTRFWNASGIELSLGASGVTLNTQSLASVLGGGIAFGDAAGAAGAADAATPAAPQATPGDRFRLYGSEKSALAPEDGAAMRVRMVFDQSLRGLEVGAPVDLLGVEIGTVRRVALQPAKGASRISMAVSADIFPARLGGLREQFTAPKGASAPRDALLLARMVEQGLRAQLRSGNLLTGQLYIALDFVPKAARARLDAGAEVPTLPTVGSSLNDLQAQLSEIMSSLAKVRFDEIGSHLQDTLKTATAAGRSLQQTLDGADATIRQLTPETRRTLAELQTTLGAVQRTLSSAQHNVVDGDAPLQRQAAQTLAELQRASQSLRLLADYLQRHPESLLRGKTPDADPSPPAEPRK